LTVFNDKLYFVAEGSSAQGRELWQLDTEGNATLAKDINTAGSGYDSDIGDFAILDQPDNFAPTDITLDSQSVASKQTGATVGSVTVTDFDDTSHSFSVSDDRFTLQDGQLKLGDGKSVDAEQTSSIDLSITATDSASNTYTEQFTVSVTESSTGDGDLVLQTQSGWFATGSTLGDAIGAPSDARYVKVFDLDAGGFVKAGGDTSTWLAPDELDQIGLQQGTYYAQSWGPDSGSSEWVNFNANIGSADNQISLSTEAFAPGTEVSLDQVVEPTQMADNGYVRVFSLQQDYGWLAADELSNHTLTAPSDGQSMPLWVDTFLSGEGRSGWARMSVEGDSSVGGGSTSVVGGVETMSDDGGLEIG
jgi:ELWxxDGT repeat protein